MGQDSSWQSLPASVKQRIAALIYQEGSPTDTQHSRFSGEYKHGPKQRSHATASEVLQEQQEQQLERDKRSQIQSSTTGHAEGQHSPAEVLEVNGKRSLGPVGSFEPALGSPASCALGPTACDGAHTSQSIISPALESSVDILDNFIGQQLLQEAREEAGSIIAAEKHTKSARIGGAYAGLANSSKGRGDIAVFVRRKTLASSGSNALVAVMDRLLGLRAELLDAGHDVNGPPSFQLACHPANTPGYRRHRDRSPSCPARQLTMICYLNPDWSEEDAGNLCIYSNNKGGGNGTSIAPQGGRLVVFDSGLEHQVLPTLADRFALTVWFSRARPASSVLVSSSAAWPVKTPHLICEQLRPRNVSALAAQSSTSQAGAVSALGSALSANRLPAAGQAALDSSGSRSAEQWPECGSNSGALGQMRRAERSMVPSSEHSSASAPPSKTLHWPDATVDLQPSPGEQQSRAGRIVQLVALASDGPAQLPRTCWPGVEPEGYSSGTAAYRTASSCSETSNHAGNLEDSAAAAAPADTQPHTLTSSSAARQPVAVADESACGRLIAQQVYQPLPGPALVQSMLQPSPAFPHPPSVPVASVGAPVSAADASADSSQTAGPELTGQQGRRQSAAADPTAGFLTWLPFDSEAATAGTAQKPAKRSLLPLLCASAAIPRLSFPEASRRPEGSRSSQAGRAAQTELGSKATGLPAFEAQASQQGRQTELSTTGRNQASAEGWSEAISKGKLPDDAAQPCAGLAAAQPAEKPSAASREMGQCCASSNPEQHLADKSEDYLSRAPENGSIFVSIAAYRDPETQWTLADLFAKAKQPELLRVGVVWQVDASEDCHFVRLAGDQRWRTQVREVRLDWREATGPCKARSLAQALWEGESYVLQIDSHMRFSVGWDKQLIAWLHRAERASGIGRAVLSAYPPAYQGVGPTASLPADVRSTLLCAERFDADGILRLRGRRLTEAHTEPLPSLFWAAGFSFSRRTLLQEVPYDRRLPFLFFGEETSMLARMWTRGFDVWAPPTAVAFHLWSRGYRHTLQTDTAPDPAMKAASQRKVRALLGAAAEAAEVQPAAEGTSSWAPSTPGSSPAIEVMGRRQTQGGAALLRSGIPAERDTGRCTSPDERATSFASTAVKSDGQGFQDVWGLGSCRSLQALWDYTGVNFGSMEISQRARLGGQANEAGFA